LIAPALLCVVCCTNVTSLFHCRTWTWWFFVVWQPQGGLGTSCALTVQIKCWQSAWVVTTPPRQNGQKEKIKQLGLSSTGNCCSIVSVICCKLVTKQTICFVLSQFLLPAKIIIPHHQLIRHITKQQQLHTAKNIG
jgi:hypothetical protein